MLTLSLGQTSEVIAHARKADPAECCGLIGGAEDGLARTVYPLSNVALDPLVTYEAAAEDLFAAQRQMRECGEQLLAIYHSHPRAAEPSPSATDVRLAFYPAAIYLIIGLAGAKPVMKGFRILERAQLWEAVEYAITDE